MTFSLRLLALTCVAGGLLLVGSASTLGAPVAGSDVVYTLDGDFDKGTLVNVNHAAPNSNQLQLNSSTSTFPFIWIALSQRCTIAKIDTQTGTILGEYRTISDSASCNESSRTTVALDGSVWVGHRGPGGVTHVGLKELNQCVDRDGSGTIETSAGYGDVRAWPGSNSNVAAAADECILHHVDTDAAFGGFADSRHMSIDASNNLWVGSYNSGGMFLRINGSTGAIVSPPKDLPCGGYGGLIDGNGVIWSAQGPVLRWDPNAADSATNPRCISTGVSVYGLAVDADGWVWGNEFGSRVTKTSPDGATTLGPFFNGSGTGQSQGLAVDSNGDVWISSGLSCSSGCTIGHLKNDGTFVGNVPTPTGLGSTGVSVDAAGKIWAANRVSHTAIRIDPTKGPLGCGGTGCADGTTRVGEVDLTVEFPATPGRPLPYPYNYSDMTGAQLLGNTAPQGTWTVTQDGGAPGTTWGTVAWNAESQGSVPAGASITAEARAADSEAALGAQAFAPVANGGAPGVTGRFIELRMTLRPNDAGASPVLSDVRICAVGAACATAAPAAASTPSADIGVTKGDAPDPVSVGSNITYTLVVTNHGPGPAPNATMVDTLPAGVTFVSVAAAHGSCTFASGRVTCTFGTLAAGQSSTVTIVARANEAGTLTNTAGVSTSVSDWNVGNNQVAISVTTVQGAFTPPATPGGATAAGCNLTVGTSRVFAGVQSSLVVRTRYDDGTARRGVLVTVRGAGSAVSGRTDAKGVARLVVAPKQATRMTVRGSGCGGAVAVAAVVSRSCAGLAVTPKNAHVGAAAAFSVRVQIGGSPAVGVRVHARGAGLTSTAVTNSAGVARLSGIATHPGIVTITVPGVLTCSKRIGVSGVFQPPEVSG